MSIRVKHLKMWLDKVDEDYIVVTENIQDSVNRHNEITGFEDDLTDEYFVLKIDNEARTQLENITSEIISLLDFKAELTEEERSLLEKAQAIHLGDE